MPDTKKIDGDVKITKIHGGGLWMYHPKKRKIARIMPDGYIEHWGNMSAMGQPTWHEEEPSSKYAFIKLIKRGYIEYGKEN